MKMKGGGRWEEKDFGRKKKSPSKKEGKILASVIAVHAGGVSGNPREKRLCDGQ